ncbi:MAG: CAP domain-containing protein [Candidatus Thermoplasmatota archaeon]|nr:CAP domain-containing protein [Candidatus Thermoplasmatota archaeon]
MSYCWYCGKEVSLPYTCNYCGGQFCADHKLPPNHNCPNIDAWMRKRPPGGLREVYSGGSLTHASVTSMPRENTSERRKSNNRYPNTYPRTSNKFSKEIDKLLGAILIVSLIVGFLIFDPLGILHFTPSAAIPVANNANADQGIAIHESYPLSFEEVKKEFSTDHLPCYVDFSIEPNTNYPNDWWAKVKIENTKTGDQVFDSHLGKRGQPKTDEHYTIYTGGSYLITISGNLVVVNLDISAMGLPATSTPYPATVSQTPSPIAQETSKSASSYSEYSNDDAYIERIDISRLETRIHSLINDARRDNGLSALSFDSRLADIARKHSQDMAEHDYFSHTNLAGEEPTDRAEKAGYPCRKDFGTYYMYGVAENIFQGYLYGTVYYTNGIVTDIDYYTLEEIAQDTVNGWMNSPGHRKNILTSTYDREGIGVAISDDEKVYVTENFF